MKNIKALLGSLAIAAILGANGYMAMSGTKAQTELTLEGVEALGQGEDYGISSGSLGWRPVYGQGWEKISCTVYSGSSSTGGSFNGFDLSVLGCGGGYNYTPESSTRYTSCQQTVTYDRRYCTKGTYFSCETDPRDCYGLLQKYGFGKAPGEL